MSDSARTHLTQARRRIDVALDALQKGETLPARDAAEGATRACLAAFEALTVTRINELDRRTDGARASIPPQSSTEHFAKTQEHLAEAKQSLGRIETRIERKGAP